MCVGDWSSDVCSSDLSIEWIRGTFAETHLAKRSKRVSLRASFSASTTAPRTSCSGRTEPVVCFCALLFRLRLRRSPPLGNVRINSTLPPLIRIFDFVSDTSSRHNQTNVCFCTRLFVSLADAEDTPVRHNQAGACFCPHLFVSLSSETDMKRLELLAPAREIGRAHV